MGIRLLVIVMSLVASTLVAAPSAVAAPKDLVAWVDGGRTVVHVSSADGVGRRTVVDLPPASGDVVEPWPDGAWSPDGSALVVRYFERGACCAVRLFDAETGASRLLGTDANDGGVTFSPDGSHVAYGDWNGNIRIVRRDGGARRTLATPSHVFAHSPEWSPDGRHLLFQHYYWEEISDLFVARTDGSRLVRLTNGEASVRQGRAPEYGATGGASWDPAGGRLAYSVTTDRGGEVWVASASGATRQRIATGAGDGFWGPSWSPDGRLIGFVDFNDVFTMRPDGSGLRRYADVPAAHLPVGVSWAPEGDQLAVTAWRSDYSGQDVLVIDGPGGAITRLNGGGYAHAIGFSPVPTKPNPPVRGIDRACPAGVVPRGTFADVRSGHAHGLPIDCATWWDLADGLGGGLFGPDRSVTRGQMATFVAKQIEAAGGVLPADPPSAFTDVEGTSHARSIDQLAAIGVVQGRNGRYEPAASVTRAQMATFLSSAYRAVTGSALTSSVDYFHDDRGNVHEATINAIAHAGFTGGIARGEYGPARSVTRAQMATFLVRPLDRFVEEGRTTTPR